MIPIPGMLMIGSAGRNIGKTAFACSLISKFSGEYEIVGVKVTTIDRRGGAPRGGEGCGVCKSLEDDYCITEETDTTLDKDTSRLLAAGAKRVLWLRALKNHLDEGLRALLEQIGGEALIVCESNSLRLVAEPDAFIMLKNAESGQFKRSARSVEKHVDRFILFDGAGFDIDLDDINIADRRWAIRRDASAVVLAGGESSRMDADKSMLPVAGKAMIQHIIEQLRPHFKEVLISTNDPEKYAFLNLCFVPDEVPDQGPLMGIVSSLDAASYETLFVTACDIPELDIALIARLLRESRDCDGAVPVASGRKLEPLFAVYNKSVISAAREAMACGKLRANEIFRRCRIKPVELGDGEGLMNINTMAEYEDFRKVYDDTV